MIVPPGIEKILKERSPSDSREFLSMKELNNLLQEMKRKLTLEMTNGNLEERPLNFSEKEFISLAS